MPFRRTSKMTRGSPGHSQPGGDKGMDMGYRTEIIIDQPQPIGNRYTYAAARPKWHTQLCDCCTDTNVCLCATFTPCILACRVAQKSGECCCLPCLPGTLIAMRTGLREKYRIEGSISKDWLVMSCCPLCGLCQLARELKIRN